jgi:hypothetical protein
MNEEPPKIPDRAPRPDDDYWSPPFWAMFGLGVFLLIASCLLCAPFNGPTPFFVGGVAAIVSLFFRGYRGIFVGFVVTIGLIMLALVVICGNSFRGV